MRLLCRWIMTLKNLKASDAGQYTCRVLNMFGSLNATFTISIIGERTKCPECLKFVNLFSDDKPEFEKTLLNSTINEGQTATFQCKVRSHIPPTIKVCHTFTVDSFKIQFSSGSNESTATSTPRTTEPFSTRATCSPCSTWRRPSPSPTPTTPTWSSWWSVTWDRRMPAGTFASWPTRWATLSTVQRISRFCQVPTYLT